MSSDKTPRGVNGAIANNRNSISSISSGDRRRQSTSTTGSTMMFAGLMNQKRNSVDGTSQARRASFADQAKPPGFLGGLWHSFTKGGETAGGGGK